jgi:hypothetical protein
MRGLSEFMLSALLTQSRIWRTNIGQEGSRAIAEAIDGNTTLTNVLCVVSFCLRDAL